MSKLHFSTKLPHLCRPLLQPYIACIESKPKIHQKLLLGPNPNGPNSVSVAIALVDTQVFSGSLKRGSCGSDFLDKISTLVVHGFLCFGEISCPKSEEIGEFRLCVLKSHPFLGGQFLNTN